jgi:hypothetical protein
VADVNAHDLRTLKWCFVAQPDPDGLTTIIHVPMDPSYKGDLAGEHIIVGNGAWQCRYRILSADLVRSLLTCVHAPRTMAEIDAEAAAAQAIRPRAIQPKPIPIPTLVPAEFHFKYRNIARLYGEEAAADAARRRKKMIERAARLAAPPRESLNVAPREVERV